MFWQDDNHNQTTLDFENIRELLHLTNATNNNLEESPSSSDHHLNSSDSEAFSSITEQHALNLFEHKHEPEHKQEYEHDYEHDHELGSSEIIATPIMSEQPISSYVKSSFHFSLCIGFFLTINIHYNQNLFA